MTDRHKEILKAARSTYGPRNQIGVAVEELCELAAALSKFIRYEDTGKGIIALKGKVLDEYADATIVLEHVRAIFAFTAVQIEAAQDRKIQRLHKWITESDSMEYTTKMRELDQGVKDCANCAYRYLNPDMRCASPSPCVNKNAFRPFEQVRTEDYSRGCTDEM